MTNVRKNLLIADLETCLTDTRDVTGCATTLDEIETEVNLLRTVFDADPDSVDDSELFGMYDRLQALKARPKLTTIQRVWRELMTEFYQRSDVYFLGNRLVFLGNTVVFPRS